MDIADIDDKIDKKIEDREEKELVNQNTQGGLKKSQNSLDQDASMSESNTESLRPLSADTDDKNPRASMEKPKINVNLKVDPTSGEG